METLSVFVTGATTFAGRSVTQLLSRHGHQVTGVTDGSVGAGKVREDGGLPVYTDLRRAAELKSGLEMVKADALVHVAPLAYNHVPHYKANWDAGTLAQTANAVMEAAKAAGVKFVLFASYAFLYGDTGGEWVDESARLHAPADLPVFQAAVQAEKHALSSGAAVLRCGFVYGPYSQALKHLADRLSVGRAVLPGNAHYANWVHAEDVARAVLAALSQQKPGEAFNIVDDTPASTAEFIGALAENLGVGHPTGGLFTRPSQTQTALLNQSLRAKNDKAKADLGWAVKYPSYRQGIDHTLMTWRAGETALV